ncbi:hypothetical protein GYMLUDRAFT_332386 [Collybiopsis luxurians FD-317 M1]|nr:hypothetical protein GYMLUDRAFT_332386 [Collybiopsis luxurians FD-317 M1]
MTSHEALAAKIKIVENHRQQLNVNGLQDKVTAPESQPRAEATGLEFKQINEGVKFGNSDKWPLVEFAGGILLLCAPTSFTVEGFMGNEEAKRVQVPLILAWGLSMHKSQGQTMERVKVDLGRVFEKGQGDAQLLFYSLELQV